MYFSAGITSGIFSACLARVFSPDITGGIFSESLARTFFSISLVIALGFLLRFNQCFLKYDSINSMKNIVCDIGPILLFTLANSSKNMTL